MSTAAATRRFGMHPKLLMDVIRRQAGTLAKAVLEAVMNSADAGAKSCRITFGPRQVVIEDDGCGITELKQIEQWFETFGQPHDESENKRYGTFRMGRGQLFSFGLNTWRTGPFEMVVDVANRGLDYDLKQNLKAHQGCRVEVDFPKALSLAEQSETENSIREWVKYAYPLEVYWNDELISADPALEKWTVVTPEAYIRLSERKSLAIYNLGIHVLDMQNYQLGTGGVIVSRQQLKVNFARNDIQHDCPIWKEIKPLVNQRATEKNKTRTLDEAGRYRVVRQYLSGEMTASDFQRLKVFTLVNGRATSLESVARDLRHTYNGLVTTAPKGDPKAVRVLSQKMALVFAPVTLERFNVKTVAKMFEKLIACDEDAWWGGYLQEAKQVKLDDVAKALDDKFELLDMKDWNPNEKIWVRMVEAFQSELLSFGAGVESRAKRKIRIGLSQTAESWTDGEHYIAFGRDYLASLDFDIRGVIEVWTAIMHAYCHDENDTEAHEHTLEFFEAFHELVGKLPHTVHRAMGYLPNIVRAEGRRLSKKAAYAVDRANSGVTARQEFGIDGPPIVELDAIDLEDMEDDLTD